MLYCTMLFNRPDTPEVSVSVGHLHLHVMHVPCTQQTQHSRLHLDRFSHFLTSHGREVYNVR